MTASASALPDYRRLPEFVRSHGWPEGLEKFIAGDRAQAARVTLDMRMRHMAWRGLLSWRQRESALVFDAGCGTAPIALSHHFERVHAVYGDRGMCDVVEKRLQYREIRNIALGCTAPDARFDAAVLYGLAPEQLTPEFLGFARSRLHRHGSAYLAFSGRRVTSLPEALRPDFHTVVRRVRHAFSSLEAYWYLGTLTSGSELRLTEGRQPRARYRIGAAASAWRGASYGLRAACENAPPSLVEEIAGIIAHKLAAGHVLIERYVFAHPAGITLIVRDAATSRRMVVRIPFSGDALERTRANAKCLQRLQALPLHPVATPRMLLADSIHGQPFFVESMVEGGVPPCLTSDPVYESSLTQAAAFLIRLHQTTAVPVRMTQSSLDRFIEPVVTAGLHRLRRQRGDAVLPDLVRFLMQAFRGHTLNTVTTHGDFTLDNLVFDSGARLRGAFDWDLSEPAGLPLIDLAYLFATATRVRVSDTKHGFLPGIARQLNALESGLVARYCEAIRVPPDLIAPLFLMSWLYHAGVRDAAEEHYLINPDFWTDVLTAVPEVIRSAQRGTE